MKIISVSRWQPSGGGRVWSESRVSLYIFTDFHLHIQSSSRWVSAQSETRNFANDLYIMKIYGATSSEIWNLLRKLLKRKWVEWTQCVLKCGARNAIWMENEWGWWVERKEKWRMFELKLDKTYFLKNMFEIVDIFSLVISLCRCIIHTLPYDVSHEWKKNMSLEYIDSKYVKLYHIFPMHNISSSMK